MRVYDQTIPETLTWFAIILGTDLLYAFLLWWLGGNGKKSKVGSEVSGHKKRPLYLVCGYSGLLASPATKALQQRDACLFAGLAGGGVPDAGLDLTDVGAAQQQHTQTALADAAADGVGQLAVQHSLVEGQRRGGRRSLRR